MKRQKIPSALIYIFISSFPMILACATSPILRMPKNLPPIVKEYKHVTVPRMDFTVNTGVYLEKGELFSILFDTFYKSLYLNARVGDREDREYISPGEHFTDSPGSGYLYFESYATKFRTYRNYKHGDPSSIGVDIIVWQRKNYDQIVQFFEKMKKEDPNNEAIINALARAKMYKELSLAEAKASKEIQETKKEIQELKEEPQNEQVTKSSSEKRPSPMAKPAIQQVEKQDKMAQLQARLSRLMETLEELKEMKSKLAEERKRTRILTKELTEKGKKEKDLLAELERRAKTPPVIAIASPKDGSRVEIERIQLSGVAEDDQGVKRLDIFVNNKLLRKKTGRGLLVTEGGYPSRVHFSERIQLQSGKNQIKIRALDSDGL